MASSDEILDAMRQAGSEFARMADSIESRLPAIGEALSKAPAYLRPLKNDLDAVVKKAAELNIDEFVANLSDANAQAGSLVKSMKSVQNAIDAVSDKATTAVGDFKSIVSEAKASSDEVDRLTRKMDKFGDSLSERAANAKDLQTEIKNAGGKFTPSLPQKAGGIGRRNTEAVVGDDQSKALTELVLKQVKLRTSAEETGRAIKEHFGEMGRAITDVQVSDIANFIKREKEIGTETEKIGAKVDRKFGDLTSPLKDVELNFQNIKSSVKALSAPLGAASKDMSELTAEDIAAWGDGAAAAVGQLAKHAEKMPGVSLIDAKSMRRLEKGLKNLKDSGAELKDMQNEAAGLRKELEKAKNLGDIFDENLAREIKAAADETRDILGVSKKEARAVAVWQAKHAKAADDASEHMGAAWANAVQLAKSVKDCPIPELASEIGAVGKGINGLVESVTKLGGIDLSNLKSLNMVSLAKAFIEVGDEVKKDRAALRELTAEAGMLSTMFQSGMGADQITGEYEKLRQSMNNMLNSWGKTEEESTGAMRSLVDAGFSMSSILGPTLKETESGLFAFARSGEHAMSGLEEIAKISAMTGKSMGSVAAMAGQWREKLGVSIGEVGETYLELESSARRSGLSVGKFMDRVMSSASGFVMFGGQVDDVANSLSNMMSGMTIPPGLAADVAADFMQRLSGITMTEAMTGVAMVGKAGTEELLKSAQSFHDVRAKEGAKLKKQIEELESSGLEAQDPKAYASKMAELQGKMRKVQEETGAYARLLEDAAKGDKTAMAALYQEEAQRGHSSARRLKVLQDAATMGIKAEALEKEGATTERALLDELVGMERSGKKRILLEQQAAAAGYKSFKEMKEIVRGQARLADAKVAWGKKLGIAGEDEEELFAIMADTGDVEGLVSMMKDKGKGPASLLKMMQEMQAEGVAISDASLEEAQRAKAEYDEAVSDFGAESEQARKAAEAMQKTAAETLAGVVGDKKMPEEVVAEHAKKQTPLLEKIEQATRSMRKFMGGPLIGMLLAIKVALDLRSLFNMQGKMFSKGLLGLGKKSIGKVGSVFSGTKFGAALTKSGTKFGGTLAKASKSFLGAGKSALKMAGKFAGPLAVAVEGVFAAMEIRGKKQEAYQDAYNRALEQGKSEIEAKEIADRASIRAITKADSGKAVGQVGGAAAGALGGAAIGAAVGSVVPILGTAVGGIIGGIVGAISGSAIGKSMGEKIGDALTTESEKFYFALEEVMDLGTLADAKALVAAEEKSRDDLQAEKMALIKKEASGEKLTSEERARLQELKQELIDKEKQVELAKHAEWMKDNEELGKKVESGMGDVAKMRLAANKKKRELRAKKRNQGGRLSDEDEKELAKADMTSKASDETLGKVMKAREAETLEKERAGIKKYASGAGGELNKAESAAVAKIDKRLAEIGTVDDPFSGQKARPVMTPGVSNKEIRKSLHAAARGPETDMLSDAAKMQADRDKEKKATGVEIGKQTTDNSTWNVHINSRSEKELQDAMLKTLVKHQQRLAN